MDIKIVGGNFGELPKSSKIVDILCNEFDSFNTTKYNGGTKLPLVNNADLIIWMPNISNSTEKRYPIKDKGAVLICSKVMREGYKRIEAVSRIFKMNGNAVIAIYNDINNKKTFELIDALGNIWINTNDIKKLALMILHFYRFTKESIRVNMKSFNDKSSNIKRENSVKELIDINSELKNHIQLSCGTRFFGNISTRCSKLFPSMRADSKILVSPRNSNKSLLEVKDMVECCKIGDTYYYNGNFKPSVDSPIQLNLYEKYKNINFMIHGHCNISNIEGVLNTKEYRVCGDLRECLEIYKILPDFNTNSAMINLKNHGFLLMASSIEELSKLVNKIKLNKEFLTYEREESKINIRIA